MAEEKTPEEAHDEQPNDEAQELSDNEEAQELEDETSSQEEEPLSQEEILQQELKACEEKYIRVHAEFENIKKRLEKEKYQAIEYASEKFAKDLITVVDSLGKAIESAKAESEDAQALLASLSEGVELTYKQLMSTLEKNGVKEIEATGELDPNVHEAVMRVDSDSHESGHIVDVMQKGYVYKDRTLRATMVSVAN